MEGEGRVKGGGREGKGREGKGACAVLIFPLKKPCAEVTGKARLTEC